MSKLLSFANKLQNVYNQFFSLDPESVVEVKIEDYVHYDIVSREDSLIFHSVADSQKINYEILLHKENQTKIAFSIYRSTDWEKSQLYFLRMKDKLPVLVKKFPKVLSVTNLQELCKYLNNNPSQNLAHICAKFGYYDYFKLYPTEAAQLINEQDDDGHTVLHIAIQTQNVTTIQSILSLPGVDLNLVDFNGNNVLHYAARTTNQIIMMLVNAINNTENQIPLMVLVNMKNKKDGFTPLSIACFNDKPACVKELLKNGADVNGASSNTTDQHQQVELSPDSARINEQLFNQLNNNDMKNGGTPLHWCRSPEVIEMLIQNINCRINARNFHGDTALHIMIDRGDLNSTISLLSHGADVNAFGSNGNTPLHVAIMANKTIFVQTLIVFGADVNVANASEDTPRHMAATSPMSPSKDIILYVLHSAMANRCNIKRSTCNEGCAPEHSYNGLPPENVKMFITKNNPLFDRVLSEHVIKKKLEDKNKNSGENKMNKKKRIKLLCMDGGGIKGLILAQILCYLETITGKRINDIFDWIAGTSTGGILALLIGSGYSAYECRNIYFRFKDKIFYGIFRPYSSEPLEKLLKSYLGSEKKMKDIEKPKLLIPAAIVDRFPPNVRFFRNYISPEELMSGGPNNSSDYCLNEDQVNTTEELLWRVARATGAAPSYFPQFESYLDGGLVSNNPTSDLLSEIQFFNSANRILGKPIEEQMDIDLVISIGTGLIPSQPFEALDFSWGPRTAYSTAGNLLKLLIEQASQANGRVVNRCESWCSMVDIPFFRLNPPISEEIQMNETDNFKLINMLWETMVYINLNQYDMAILLQLLLED